MYVITGLHNSKIVGNQLPFEIDFKLMKQKYFYFSRYRILDFHSLKFDRPLTSVC